MSFYVAGRVHFEEELRASMTSGGPDIIHLLHRHKAPRFSFSFKIRNEITSQFRIFYKLFCLPY
jgi:hypothetical protein